MIIFTSDIIKQLARNGRATRQEQETNGKEIDHKPVIKVFNPVGSTKWLFTESDPDDPDRLFGLCDLGLGMPELGYASRNELEQLRIPIMLAGLPRGAMQLERDMGFTASHRLSVYARAAREALEITEHPTALERATEVLRAERKAESIEEKRRLALQRLEETKKFWLEELHRVFLSRAEEVRHTAEEQGAIGSELRKRYDAFIAAYYVARGG